MNTTRAFFCFGMAILVGGCGPNSSGRGQGPGGDGNPDLTAMQQGNNDGGMQQGPQDAGPIDNDAFWAQDPPPMYCALDGGAFPPPMNPGGTPECPDDKNREGCPCPQVGMTASCWPGLRVNRNLGDCKDGTTTCQTMGELGQGWGPCMGYVLPDPNGTGKAACHCFSAGKWAIDNLSPCFYQMVQNGPVVGTTSSYLVNGQTTCMDQMGMIVQPNMPWSTDTVTADCEGHFKLCYTLKAGDVMNPSMNDCVVASVCTEADYTQTNMAQPFPPLPAFASTSQAQNDCATKFNTTGGYGEMTVDGETILCDMVQKVFNRVGYCSAACQQNPNMMGCSMCSSGGGGNF